MTAFQYEGRCLDQGGGVGGAANAGEDDEGRGGSSREGCSSGTGGEGGLAGTWSAGPVSALVACGPSVSELAGSRGRCCASGVGGSGGEDGGVLTAPSSWAKAELSPGDDGLRRFLALVSLGENAGLQLTVAATSGVTAAVAAGTGAHGHAAI